MRPDRNALASILRGCGITLDATQLDRLWTYHQMLREANVRLNLTRIHNFENMVLKHYVDSLLVLGFTELPSPLIDMGSGPGLPGIPLKIARPETRMILAEPRGARAEFLAEVCERLGLHDIVVHPRKLDSRFPGPVAGVISRAVGTIPETLDRVAACLGPGGRMLFMKGPECDPEIEAARREHAATFQLAADHHYSIPGTPHLRRLVIYERLDSEVPARLLERTGSSLTTAPFEGVLREVSSASNPSFRLFRDILAGRGIRKHSHALIAGPRVVAEVLSRHRERIEGWITPTAGPWPSPPVEGVPWFRLVDPLFRELDVAGTHQPLLLVNVPEPATWSDDDPWPPGCTLFIPFQDPENVGAVIRSAAAFGVARVVLLREAAHPFHPRASRAAGTALFQMTLLQGPSIQDLQSRHAPLIALDTSGPTPDEEPFPPRFGLVPGVEGPGLPEALRHGRRLRIPIAPAVESLNAATATAVALYSWSRSRPEVAPPPDAESQP